MVDASRPGFFLHSWKWPSCQYLCHLVKDTVHSSVSFSPAEVLRLSRLFGQVNRAITYLASVLLKSSGSRPAALLVHARLWTQLHSWHSEKFWDKVRLEPPLAETCRDEVAGRLPAAAGGSPAHPGKHWWQHSHPEYSILSQQQEQSCCLLAKQILPWWELAWSPAVGVPWKRTVCPVKAGRGAPCLNWVASSVPLTILLGWIVVWRARDCAVVREVKVLCSSLSQKLGSREQREVLARTDSSSVGVAQWRETGVRFFGRAVSKLSGWGGFL